MGLSHVPAQFSQDGYTFTRIDSQGWGIVDGWLSAPHLRDWWTPDVETVQSLKSGETARAAYVVDHNGWPFAYLQLGVAAADPELAAAIHAPDGSVRIDQFIGDTEMIGYGHGIKFMKALIAAMKANAAVPKVYVAPAKENIFAIRSYSQCGFRQEKIIDDITGQLVVMGQNT